MCYSVYLSTDCSDDLSKNNNELIKFKKVDDKAEDPSISLLSHQHIWYVGSQHDCSCGFRHILSLDLGFSEPVDWYEEDSEDIEATKQIYRILKKQIEKGFKVDCVDIWEGTEIKNIKNQIVSFSEVEEIEFRFFENYMFEIK